jgi:Ca2+-transporting ATPase
MREGLTQREAAKRLERFGPNEIVDRPRQRPIQIFVTQFTSLLVVLLIIASVASLFLGDLLDGIFILLIVLLNGILGFIQEYKAEKAITALKTMTVSSVRVIRDGFEQKIDSRMLVPGDVIHLTEGDKIPADCIVIHSVHLTANEASLTGESMPVEKNSIDEDKRRVYLGTIITKGRGKARVTVTGMQTRFGTIAGSLSNIVEEETPLEKKLSVLGKQLGILAILASVVVFVIGFVSKQPPIEMILTSISLAVAAVPEGLPAVITITLAIGMQRMARKKALVRRLASIETLGSTTIIATDKTGTLTKNQMRVTDIWLGGKSAPLLHSLITCGVVCNNASLVVKENHGGFDTLGDTTEAALLLLAVDKGMSIEKLKQDGTLIEEFGFDANLKLMSVVWGKDRQTTIFSKGAPEVILSRSTSILDDTGVKNLTPKIKKDIEAAFQQYARDGLRVIAFASRSVRQVPVSRGDAEQELTFVGFVGIADPPREEVKDAISLAESAGIRTIMITGDNEITAKTIGTRLGLIHKNEEVITGSQFSQMTDEEAIKRLPIIRIFARITPEQKLRIVQLLQRAGHVVAVTGDGVNDALALKQSDIGVSMGITGTDVAKEASDMIISDDNYATIVTAVEEGRTIFDNIKSAIKYLVGCNIGEVIAVVAGMLMGWPLILTPLQLLYINLVTDGLPAIALAVTPKHEHIMKRMPRTTKNIFDRIDIIWIIEVSLLTAGTTLVASWIGQKTGTLALSRALAFTTMILVQHFILLDLWVRERSFWQGRIFSDKVFRIAFFVPLILQLFLLYIPSLSDILKITRFSLGQLVAVVLLSLVVLVVSEIRKYVLHRLPVTRRH